MEQEKTYNIRVHGIDIVEKAIYKIPIKAGDIFGFEVKSQAFIDHDKSLVVTFIDVGIKTNDSPNLVGKIMCGIGYFFENFEESFQKDSEGNYTIPTELESLLRNISISTTRGLMYAEFRGTQLHSALLPIIIPNSLTPIEGSLIHFDNETNNPKA
jgi:hypothetical protein